METVLNLLLIRFAVIVGALVGLALLLFAVLLALKRSGRLDRARQWAAPAARGVAEHLADRRQSRRRAGDRRGDVSRAAAGAAVGAAVRALEGGRRSARAEGADCDR